MSEVNAYAYEGLASICATSRKISGAQAQEMKAIHVENVRDRRELLQIQLFIMLQSSYGAFKEEIALLYEECSALLK